MKPDGTKVEILPALIAAEQQGVFKGAAVHPYYLKKAAYNTDRPYENTDWGTPPKGKRPDRLVNYRALQKEAKALGIGGRCMGLKGPALEEEIRKARHEQGTSEGQAEGSIGHASVPGERGPVDQSEAAITVVQGGGSAGVYDKE